MQKQQRATQTEKANECWAGLILFCGSFCGFDIPFPAALQETKRSYKHHSPPNHQLLQL